MTIIVFLIDTSASMNQRAYLGGRPTLLDVAKGAVETFVKVGRFSVNFYSLFEWKHKCSFLFSFLLSGTAKIAGKQSR